MSDKASASASAKSETLGRIMAAAADEFSSHGFEAARISRIAEAASVSKQTVYDYFVSKEQLCYHLLAHITRNAEEMICRQRYDLDDPLGCIEAFSRAVYRYSSVDNGRIEIRALTQGWGLPPQNNYETSSTTVMRLLHEIVDRGKAKGVIRQSLNPMDLYLLITISYPAYLAAEESVRAMIHAHGSTQDVSIPDFLNEVIVRYCLPIEIEGR